MLVIVFPHAEDVAVGTGHRREEFDLLEGELLRQRRLLDADEAQHTLAGGIWRQCEPAKRATILRQLPQMLFSSPAERGKLHAFPPDVDAPIPDPAHDGSGTAPGPATAAHGDMMKAPPLH